MFFQLVQLFLIWLTYPLAVNYPLNQSYDLGYPKTTVTSPFDNGDAKPISASMITFMNSSSRMHSLLFRLLIHHIGTIHERSYIYISDCLIEILNRNSPSAFISEGQITVERMAVYSAIPLHSIVQSQTMYGAVADSSTSSVAVKSSMFGDVRVYESDGGLISGVYIRREEVIGCSFVNISGAGEAGEKKKKKKKQKKKTCPIVKKIM